MDIPFMRLDRQFASISEAVMPAIFSVLESGRVLQSPEVERLEERLAHMHGLKHCVAVNTGTDALIFAVACLGLPEGSRIAVPAMTFVASASAIVHNRCRPVFVDVDPDTMLMDEAMLLDLIRGREVEAIVAVHLYGQILDLEGVAREAKQQGIALIEDAAQVLGATRFGAPAGAHGDITCLSFDPTKTVNAYGSGGALLTDNDDFAENTRLLRYHGHSGNGIYERPGFNSQMQSLQAAIIDVKLNFTEQWQRRRTEISTRLTQGLRETPGVRLLRTLPGNVHNFHKLVVSLEDRDTVQQHLANRGVQTRIHYPVPMHLQPCFADGSAPISLPRVERAAGSILSFPMYAELTDEEVDYITQCTLEACRAE